jgi:tetratricopeptide (TPR) repeat protein/predicted aspartyl protease
MAVRPFPVWILLFALSAVPLHAFAAAGCKIGKIAELPVTMNGLRPMVTAKINGVEAKFIADSGAFFSLITLAGTAEYTLRTKPAPFRLMLEGVGGSAEAKVTTVKEFTLAGVPIHNVEFVVGGSDPGGGAVGLLGQNVLRIADVEFDLANGAIRLMKPDGCGKTMMAYWGKPGDVYSQMDIAWATAGSPNTSGTAYLNGAKIRVVFDTGAATSVLSLRAAERAGVKTDSPGVVEAGRSSGIGSRSVPNWIGPFQSFKIGDEEIHNIRLRMADIGRLGADMLIGADFFLSHRIYVASSQSKLYFTYNGGPVFDLRAIRGPVRPEPGTAEAGVGANGPEHLAAGSATPADNTVASTTVPASGLAPASAAPAGDLAEPSIGTAPLANDSPPPPIPEGQPTDAAGFARRGSAYAARRDFPRALADLTRACELAPNEPDYFFERGRIRSGLRQPLLAMNDFDQAIKLKPDYFPALMARAEMRLARRDRAGGDAGEGDAIVDLDKVSTTVAKEADVRLELGALYARAGAFAPAISQFDLWLDKHTQDAKAPVAFASRCRARGMLGQDLDKALSDCNRAVKMRSDAAFYLDSRGLIFLRTGSFDKAIADYDAVMRQQPRNAWALYCRGLAKLRKGMAAEGQADIAASKALAPRAAEDAAKRGLVP